MGIKFGLCGLGGFGKQFLQLFQAHPFVDEVIITDLDKERLRNASEEFGIENTVENFDQLLKTDVDAVGIFTQRWKHCPQAVKALKAGKHVYSAVPAAVTLEELRELVETVKETGLLYMLGETSYYRPQSIYCRRRFSAGDFGRFVYGEGQYYHDMYRFYAPFYGSNDEDWKSFASFPPMLYPTHSVSHILSVTFSRMTEVSCFGFKDNHPDGIFREEISRWNNSFSNQTGLFRTADGGTARINEFRRAAAGESRMSIIGTDGAYEEQPVPYEWAPAYEAAENGGYRDVTVNSAVWVHLDKTEENPSDGEFDYRKKYIKPRYEDVSGLHSYFFGVEITSRNLGDLPRDYIGKKHLGVCSAHPVERLPKEFVGLPNKHCGSHQFLVVDFLESIRTGKLPPNHVWAAARYNAPGIVAHASSMKNGELMKIPDFGAPPENAELLDPLSNFRD
jgi:predicted dehydrogenase